MRDSFFYDFVFEKGFGFLVQGFFRFEGSTELSANFSTMWMTSSSLQAMALQMGKAGATKPVQMRGLCTLCLSSAWGRPVRY